MNLKKEITWKSYDNKMAQGYNVDVKVSQKRKKWKSSFAVIGHFKAACLL